MPNYPFDIASYVMTEDPRQAGDTTEIEITPAMIEAGAAMLRLWNQATDDPHLMAEAIIQAAISASA